MLVRAWEKFTFFIVNAMMNFATSTAGDSSTSVATETADERILYCKITNCHTSSHTNKLLLHVSIIRHMNSRIIKRLKTDKDRH